MFMKKDIQKRTKEIRIRCSDDEYKMLLDRKTNPRLATWIREIALGEKPKKKAKQVDPDLLFQLNKIGVNLNQIAKHLNESNKAGTNINIAKIAISLRSIEEHFQKIISKL